MIVYCEKSFCKRERKRECMKNENGLGWGGYVMMDGWMLNEGMEGDGINGRMGFVGGMKRR